jgi:hypothetical protein
MTFTGSHVNEHGYIRGRVYGCPWRPDGTLMYEHRYKIEKHLGRKLKQGEVVHHINGNKKDNRGSNLSVTTWTKHVTSHDGRGAFNLTKLPRKSSGRYAKAKR